MGKGTDGEESSSSDKVIRGDPSDGPTDGPWADEMQWRHQFISLNTLPEDVIVGRGWEMEKYHALHCSCAI